MEPFAKSWRATRDRAVPTGPRAGVPFGPSMPRPSYA